MRRRDFLGLALASSAGAQILHPIMGGDRRLFRYKSSLRSQALLKVSMYGDSITAGSFNVPKASCYWVPEAANRIMSADAVVSGANLFGPTYVVAGVTEASGVFTITASGGQTNPRFAQASSATAATAGSLYRFSGELDTTGCVGKHLALRYFPATASNQQRFIGTDEATSGYEAFSVVVSSDFLNSLTATTLLNFGGSIVATETDGVGLIRNVEVKAVTKGISVHNQGTSGWTAAEGVTNIATVTAWTPHVVILGFGTNDLRNGVTLADYQTRLTSMVSSIVAAGGYPVLATLPPLASDQANYTLVPAWNAAIKTLSLTLQCGFWDRWKALDNGSLTYIDDGRHPTRAGYLMLAQSAADLLRERIAAW